MTDASAVSDLNRMLSGSPYLMPGDERGELRADFLIGKSEAIERRQQRVVERFAAQSAEIRNRTERLLDARAVYESNALEFAGMSLEDTTGAIDQAGTSIDDLARHIASLPVNGDPHLVEVLGLYRATLFTELLAQEFRSVGLPLREIDVRDLHRFTLPGKSFAGGYKTVEVEIAGSDLQTSGVIDVQAHMQELVRWTNESNAMPPLAATVVHSWLAMIHPFQDGNGRVARLLANLILLRAGWPPLIVRKSDRLQYLDALTHSDQAGDILPLFDLFIKSIGRGLKELEDPELARKLFESDLRKNHDKRYTLWRKEVDSFMSAVRGTLLTAGWDVNVVDVPSHSEFLMLNKSNAAGNTWFAKLRGPTGEDFLLWFGYMSPELDAWISDGFGWPSIWISERDRREEAVHPYRPPWEYSRLDIQEVVLGNPVSEHPAFVRHGSTVIERAVLDAARDVADALLSVG